MTSIRFIRYSLVIAAGLSLLAILSSTLSGFAEAAPKPVGSTLNTSLTQLAPATKYFVKVIAYDEAGNASTGATGNATTTAAGTRRTRQLISD